MKSIHPIHKKIKALREALGLTQSAFAGKIGVVRSTVAKWEAGDSMPAANHIALICERLRIGPSSVLGLEAEKLPESAHDRLSRVLQAEGVQLASQLLDVPEGIWPAVIDGRFQVSPDSMKELASSYRVSMDWLLTGAPASWDPSLDSGISVRLRFLRICLGIPRPNDTWQALEKSESYAQKHVEEAIGEIDSQRAQTAVNDESSKRLGSLFPFNFEWVITGKMPDL